MSPPPIFILVIIPNYKKLLKKNNNNLHTQIKIDCTNKIILSEKNLA